MPVSMESVLASLFATLALPQYGLSTVFVISLISATLLPLGSEPVVLGLVKLNPELFWPAIGMATAGNTLGGAINWWMGHKARQAFEVYRAKHPPKQGSQAAKKPSRLRAWATLWLQKLGPRACLLSWLPGIGDPLCAVAGWLSLPFWPCAFYMAIGKCLRYIAITSALAWAFVG